MAGKEFVNDEVLMACSIDNLKESGKGNVVVSGCEVTANATPDMFVNVSSGEIIINGLPVAISAVDNQAITAAHATLDRYDIICVGSNGTVDYISGTAASEPKPPNLTADHVLLAIITVGAGVTSIDSGDISDERIINANPYRKKGMFLKASYSGSVDNLTSTGTTIQTISFAAGELNHDDLVIIEMRGSKKGGTGNPTVHFDVDGVESSSWTMSGNTWITTKIGERQTGTSGCLIRTHGIYDTESLLQDLDSGSPDGGDDWFTEAWDLLLVGVGANNDEDLYYKISVYVLRGE